MLGKRRFSFGSVSYRDKLLTLLLPSVFITMALMYFVSVRQTNYLIVNQHKHLYSDQCDMIANALEVNIKQALATTETVLYNNSVYAYLFEDAALLPAFDRIALQSDLRKYSSSICRQNNYHKLWLYVKGIGASENDNASSIRRIEQFERIVRLDNHTLMSRLDQVAVSGVYYSNGGAPAELASTMPLISVVRYIIDGTLDNVAGIVAIELDASQLLNAWDDSYYGGGCTLKLMDQYGVTIDSCGGGEVVENEGLHIEIPIGNYGWTLTASVSEELLSYGNVEVAHSLLEATLIICALLLITVIAITRGMTRRLLHLTDSIYQNAFASDIRSLRHLKIDEEREGNDEADKLIRAYNQMLYHIDRLSQEFETSIKRETESRFLVLQSQINPHFLYNTLAVIKSYIEINDSDQATNLLMCLSDYFRRALSNGAFVITLQEELEIVAKYLNIQKIVYEGHLTYSIDVSADIGAIHVPKFILQPFVENAVLHSACHDGQTLDIRIRGTDNRESICIMIEDNGLGITEKMREVLMNEREPNADEHLGYGIRNVRNRLNLFFNDKASLCFSNLPTGGTRVEIQIFSLERRDSDDSGFLRG